ncbi:DUF1016 family protein [Gordonia pseudamarae]|jgi:predicted nuclease of restriction endonuclease-like (RecB) superfamily|uniref:DUF1016 family protein n=1 Tax=Gordonia pseudamarae TaxID=2831662 RepID=A0ABX6ILL6_9ACTN|nr:MULTISPECIES: PDDEXK nuclease domain-containing protein [Gordonia]MBD0020760.1 DUF1016 domain-containing protein [Gordonia sp. (in: high G+C Gram-positive bacteria)]QHN27794.1 DUF1016 family protein [Gordonia pseudamarae]QHN36675.1 DUF1016 family protein [Gordonia pseudamarae]
MGDGDKTELERRGQPSDLFDQVSALIDQTRAVVAAQANVSLTMMNWQIGHLINTKVLGEQRAEYAQEIVATLSPQLTKRYGRGFDKSSLHRMVRFVQTFPDRQIVATLGQQLSWSHFKVLLPVHSDEARDFYIQQALDARLSVRALRELIGRQGFERREIANAQTPGGSTVPLDSFRDPYFLDFLGLRDVHAERDIEEALIREMETFLLEAGNGWAFVARQKRMTVDNDDFFLDLLFFSRPLRRLIAVELKIGKFKPAYEGQMKFYLKWLDRYERRKDEEAPLGLILCTETSREQIEMMEMHKDGIVVAEYWTTLPPKEILQRRITEIYRAAQERIARRALGPAGDDEDDE